MLSAVCNRSFLPYSRLYILRRMSMSLHTSTRRGAFIVLEGCDRAGKSTQCEKLVERLNNQGSPAKLIKFPDRTTPIGQMINSYLTSAQELDDHVVHLLFSANRWEALKSLKETLLSGTTLIVDRYVYSGATFSAAKGLDLAWCKSPDIGLLAPDLTLFLDLPVEIAEQRGGFGTERYEKKEMQRKVRELFLDMKEDGWVVINANQEVKEIHEICWEAVKDVLARIELEDLREGLRVIQ